MFLVTRGIYPFIAYEGALATCPIDDDLGCTFENLWNNGAGIASLDVYNYCACVDNCGAVSLDNVPLRKGATLAAYLTSNQTENLKTNGFRLIYLLNAMFLCFITLYGIIGLAETRWTQKQLRSKLFRILGGKSRRSQRKSFGPKFRYYFGKTVAGGLFLFTVLAAVVSPLVFVSSVVVNEIVIWDWPARQVSLPILFVG